MVSIVQSAPRVKPSRPLTASLTLTINGTRYNVTAIRGIQDPEIQAAWRLEKHGDPDAVYDVARGTDGLVTCSCPSYEVTYRGNGLATCKHGSAVVQLGLLPAPSVHVEPSRPASSKAPEPIVTPLPLPPNTCALPQINGNGLVLDELFRINGARNRARSAYAADCPAASSAELDRVAAAAARDMLRRVLKDRPPAPELPAAAACCQEADPCKACSPAEAVRTAPVPAIDDDQAEGEGDPSTWPAWTDADAWELGPDPDDLDDVDIDVDYDLAPAEASALLTLPELIDQQAARLRRMETYAGDLMARSLTQLAEMVRSVQASTPGDYAARLEVLDRDQGDREPSPAPERHPGGWWS